MIENNCSEFSLMVIRLSDTFLKLQFYKNEKYGRRQKVPKFLSFYLLCFPQFYLCFHVQLEMHSKTRSHHSIVAKKKRKKNRNIVENENKEK